MPEISKDDFQRRLVGVVNGHDLPEPVRKPEGSVSAAQGSSAEMSDSPSTPAPDVSAMHTYSPPQSAEATNSCTEQTYPERHGGSENTSRRNSSTQKIAPANLQPPEDGQNQPITRQEKTENGMQKSKNCNVSNSFAPLRKDCDRKPQVSYENPAQYRLQVRLFDGSSVRSSFSPTQTICSDVRSWLDQKMGTEQRPYNLKHILTPVPSRTLSVSEESQTLRDLGLGSTANLVMVPVPSYTDAYSTSSSSLPVRSVSAVYNAVSSAITTATGLVSSLAGYSMTGSTTSDNESSTATGQFVSSNTTQRPRTIGPNIRTLGDQENDGDNKQFYNGNQVGYFDPLT